MSKDTSTIESTYEIGNYLKPEKGEGFSVEQMMWQVNKMLYLQDIAKIHQDKLVTDWKPVIEAVAEANDIAAEYADKPLEEVREVYIEANTTLSPTNN